MFLSSRASGPDRLLPSKSLLKLQCEIAVSLAVDEHDTANVCVGGQALFSLLEQIVNLHR